MRLRRLLPCGFIVLALPGCVAQNMNKGLNALMGQNISVAENELGFPDGERNVMGQTVYVWGSNQSFNMPVTTYSTTTGTVGNTPYYGTTANTNYEPMNFNCTIQIEVAPDGTISRGKWEGNMGGCAHYASALNQNN